MHKWLVLSIFLALSPLVLAREVSFSEGRDISDGDNAWFADLDKDGDQDVIVSVSYVNAKGWSFDYQFWLENSGTRIPTFTRHDFKTNQTARYRFLPIDLDADGDMDFIGNARDLSWFENNGVHPPVFVEHVLPIHFPGWNVEAADMNRDGRQDLVCTLRDDLVTTSQQIYWLEVSGSNPVQITPHTMGMSKGELYFTLADMDRDGDTDVIVSKPGSSVWLENRGTSSPTFIQHPLSTKWAYIPKAADFNGDGRMDLVLGYDWLENKGGFPPTFTPHRYYAPVPLGDDPPHMSVTIGDLNLDGFPDIIPDADGWFENSGGNAPTFTYHAYPIMAKTPDVLIYSARDPKIFDADHDGDLDLIMSRFDRMLGPRKLVLFKNLRTEQSSVIPALWRNYD